MRPSKIHSELAPVESGDVISNIRTAGPEYNDVEVLEIDTSGNTTLVQTNEFTIKIPMDREGGTITVELVSDEGVWQVYKVSV
jgi:hypothetical protein